MHIVGWCGGLIHQEEKAGLEKEQLPPVLRSGLSLNCHSLRAPATAGSGWSDCPKTQRENPRMPGYQLLALPPMHGKVQAALVWGAWTPLANAWLPAGLSGKQVLSRLSLVQGGRKIVSQKGNFFFKKMWKLSTTPESAEWGWEVF